MASTDTDIVLIWQDDFHWAMCLLDYSNENYKLKSKTSTCITGYDTGEEIVLNCHEKKLKKNL